MVLSIDSMLGRRWAAITTSMGHGVTRCGLELRLVKVGGVGLAFQPVLRWEPARSIPLRKFGRADAQISALGFGGHHLGEATR